MSLVPPTNDSDLPSKPQTLLSKHREQINVLVQWIAFVLVRLSVLIAMVKWNPVSASINPDPIKMCFEWWSICVIHSRCLYVMGRHKMILLESVEMRFEGKTRQIEVPKKREITGRNHPIALLISPHADNTTIDAVYESTIIESVCVYCYGRTRRCWICSSPVVARRVVDLSVSPRHSLCLWAVNTMIKANIIFRGVTRRNEDINGMTKNEYSSVKKKRRAPFQYQTHPQRLSPSKQASKEQHHRILPQPFTTTTH